MSHSLPIFFGCVDKSLSLPTGSKPEDAYEAEEFDRLHQVGGLWSDISRNWWHIRLAAAMVRAQALDGLNFLEGEDCMTISTGDLEAVVRSLDQIVKSLSDATAEIGEDDIKNYADIVRRPEYLVEMTGIAPSQDNADSSERKPDFISDDRIDAVSFYRFLVSLRSVAQEAASTGQSMLWLTPAP